jgi:hypothetical protein
MITIKLTPKIVNEWLTRCVGDYIPELESWAGESVIQVDERTAVQIANDCIFYIGPHCVDATLGERASYRALLKQVTRKLDALEAA